MRKCLLIFSITIFSAIFSLYVAPGYNEDHIANNLFVDALEIFNEYQVSKVIAVSCPKFEQELRLLQERMALDNTVTKKFFVLLGNSIPCG